MQDLQADYCKTTAANLDRLRSGPGQPEQCIALARRDLSAFLRVMRDDPLLPRPLWPKDYLGPEVVRLHRELAGELHRRL